MPKILLKEIDLSASLNWNWNKFSIFLRIKAYILKIFKYLKWLATLGLKKENFLQKIELRTQYAIFMTENELRISQRIKKVICWNNCHKNWVKSVAMNYFPSMMHPGRWGKNALKCTKMLKLY